MAHKNFLFALIAGIQNRRPGCCSTLSTCLNVALQEQTASSTGVCVCACVQESVYVKFVSESAAGQAFKALHGWMYDGTNSVLIVCSQLLLNQPLLLMICTL